MKKKLILYGLVAVALLLTVPVGGAQAWARLPSGLPDMAMAGELGSELFLQSGSTGMVLVVVRGDEVFFRGYGETAPGSGQVPTRDSVVRLCSLTKIFTTDLLAKMVADRTVRLEDPLQRYAPHGVVAPKRGGAITLLEMATHTSGLPRELGSGPANTAHFTFPDYKTRWRWLPNQKLRSVPGTAALYSNVTFDFLSDALAAAAHEPYARLLAERTLNPLHMGQTTLYPSAGQCAHLLMASHEEGPCTVTEQTEGSSGLYSTAADMTVWLKYLVGVGAVKQEAEAQAVYVQPAKLKSEKGLDHAGEPTGVGLGWIHLLAVDSESHLVEKTGGGAGFETYIAINHARRTAVFLAATDGVESHLNLYNAANKLLLAVAGLPPLPAPAVVVKQGRRHRRR